MLKKKKKNQTDNKKTKKTTKNKISNSCIQLNFFIVIGSISRIISWCLLMRKNHKDSQIPFILEEGSVASTLNESLDTFT